MKYPTSDELAWKFADVVSGVLPRDARDTFYVQLGSRNFHLAIAEALEAAVALDITLPRGLLHATNLWLDAYRAHPDQHRLRVLLASALQQGNTTFSPPLRGRGRYFPQ